MHFTYVIISASTYSIVLCFIKKSRTLAGLEPGPSVPQGGCDDHCARAVELPNLANTC
jgi:hypothetical protein